jgi:uncharacterized protein YcbK (DUF882 family)
MSDYKYFKDSELACKHTGENGMDVAFMKIVEAIREECGFPFRVSSAYRHPTHPIEAGKQKPGAHASGKAIDILVSMEQAFILVEVALKHGIIGIGISQKGPVGTRFIHLDMDESRSRPRIWSY